MLCCVVLCCVVLCCVVLCCVLSVWRGYLFHGIRVGFHVWVLVSRFGLDRPSLDRPSPGPPKISLFFSLSRRKIRSFLPSLGVFSLNFGGVFEGRDPQMCTFGVLWLSCSNYCRTLGTTFFHQERRPQVRVREIPHDVSTFTPERPLALDAEMFSKCPVPLPGALRAQEVALMRC